MLDVDGHLQEKLPQKHIYGGKFHEVREVKSDVFTALRPLLPVFRIELEPVKIIMRLKKFRRCILVHDFERDAESAFAIVDYLRNSKLRGLTISRSFFFAMFTV